MKNFLIKLSKKRSRQGLYEFLNQEFSKIPQDSKVLTVGSGGEINKLLSKYSISKGFHVLSFDIDQERNPDIVGDICNFNFEDKKFDVVVICEVLEHVHSPHLAIENIHKILKTGGKLILSTPFILPLHDIPHDYYRFTKFGLMFLLSKFSAVQVQERNSYFEAIDVLWVRIISINSKRSYLISKVIIPFIFYIKRPLTLFLGKLLTTNAMTTGYNVTATKSQE